jgi:hypothetical protein
MSASNCKLVEVGDNHAQCENCGTLILIRPGILPRVTCGVSHRGIGTLIARILKFFGVTPLIYVKLRNRFLPRAAGVERGCGCRTREIQLNIWSSRTHRFFRRLVNLLWRMKFR